jgi:hypothetical protein
MAAWGLWALAILGVATLPWFDHLFRQARRPDLTQLHATTTPLVVASVVAATVGAVLAGRRPRHPVGWLLLALGLSVTASGVVDGYGRYGLLIRPGALPAARPATIYLGFVCVGFMLLLTPSGSLPPGACGAGGRGWPRPRRWPCCWRWWSDPGWCCRRTRTSSTPALAATVTAAIAAALAVAVGGLAVGAWSLVVRYRRARGTERQQLRWVAFAAAVTLPLAAVVLAGVALDATETLVVLLAAGAAMALLPLATGAAILRYRLYDLDRIISRTLAYALLTLLLGGGYTVVVLGLGQLLGRDSSLVVAAATLGVAAAFQPARWRVQQVVDRRFDRHRYDTAQTIAGFSARLRDEVGLDTLSAELLAVVERSMQPTAASLWLRQRS